MAWLATAIHDVVYTSPAVTASQTVSRPRDWFDADRRKIHILYVSPEWAKDRASAFDAESYAKKLENSGIKAVELYSKDH